MIIERLKKVRKIRGLTQEELGKLIGKAESTIARYESGMIKNLGPDIIYDLGRALNVSPLYLVGWSDDFEDFASFIEDKKDYVSEDTREDYRLVNFAVNDKSMDPKIPLGSLVVLDTTAKPSTGDIVCAKYTTDEKPVLRKYYEERGYKILIPENISFDVIIEDEEHPIEIVGVVRDIILSFK